MQTSSGGPCIHGASQIQATRMANPRPGGCCVPWPNSKATGAHARRLARGGASAESARRSLNQRRIAINIFFFPSDFSSQLFFPGRLKQLPASCGRVSQARSGMRLSATGYTWRASASRSASGSSAPSNSSALSNGSSRSDRARACCAVARRLAGCSPKPRRRRPRFGGGQHQSVRPPQPPAPPGDTYGRPLLWLTRAGRAGWTGRHGRLHTRAVLTSGGRTRMCKQHAMTEAQCALCSGRGGG